MCKYSSGGVGAMLSLISDVLLGVMGSTSLPVDAEYEAVRQAGKGLLHAALVASLLARRTGKYAFVAVTDELLTGIVAAAQPRRLGGRLSMCAVNLGIPLSCDMHSVAEHWPREGRRVRVALLDPEAAKHKRGVTGYGVESVRSNMI